MEQAETQEAKVGPPPKKPKTEEEQYNEVKAKPEHKWSVKERDLVVRFEKNREAVRKHLALVAKVSEKTKTFGNAESGRARREITDKVAKLAPEDQAITQKILQDRKVELKSVDRTAKKVMKRIEQHYAKRRKILEERWSMSLERARAVIQARYKEYEHELTDALGDIRDHVESFLELIPEMTDEQLQALLDGKAVEIKVGKIKETVAIPGV